MWFGLDGIVQKSSHQFADDFTPGGAFGKDGRNFVWAEFGGEIGWDWAELDIETEEVELAGDIERIGVGDWRIAEASSLIDFTGRSELLRLPVWTVEARNVHLVCP